MKHAIFILVATEAAFVLTAAAAFSRHDYREGNHRQALATAAFTTIGTLLAAFVMFQASKYL